MLGDPLSPDHPGPARAPLRLGLLCAGYGGSIWPCAGCSAPSWCSPPISTAASPRLVAVRFPGCSTSATSPSRTQSPGNPRHRDHAGRDPARRQPPAPPPRRPPRRRPPRRRRRRVYARVRARRRGVRDGGAGRVGRLPRRHPAVGAGARASRAAAGGPGPVRAGTAVAPVRRVADGNAARVGDRRRGTVVDGAHPRPGHGVVPLQAQTALRLLLPTPGSAPRENGG